MEKPKSIRNIEDRMGALPPDSFRYQVLDSARAFKNSWIQLGQCLYSVHKDKLFKGWGYLTFEAYCAKEIGIRQSTAVKLLKSYSFLETEEPAFLKRQTQEGVKPSQIPGLESVNALRLAKASDRLDEETYDELREDVLEHAKEDGEIKKKIKYMLKTRRTETADDGEVRKSVAKRLLSQLASAKAQAAEVGLPAKVTKKIQELMELLEEVGS